MRICRNSFFFISYRHLTNLHALEEVFNIFIILPGHLISLFTCPWVPFATILHKNHLSMIKDVFLKYHYSIQDNTAIMSNQNLIYVTLFVQYQGSVNPCVLSQTFWNPSRLIHLHGQKMKNVIFITKDEDCNSKY